MAQSQIDKLKDIIANSDNAKNVERAKKQLELLEKDSGSAPVSAMPTDGGGDNDVNALIATLQKLVDTGGGNATVSTTQVRDIVNRELATRKITENDLSDQLRAMLNKMQSTRNVQLILNAMGIISTVNIGSDPLLSRPLTQRVLSDIDAHNNIYLYGSAGTGKTYLAEAAARFLGWTPVIINCNQYTSPLEILGGQTIDGYQEGKLPQAWGNFLVDANGVKTPIKGAILILDELPKIDPNTAGVLNDALARVKRGRFENGNFIPPTITNGRNEAISMGNFAVIATGNVPLNTIDPDYEANFKQDLSLQDRFIGSTYKVFADYEYEADTLMRGYLFIWLFCVKMREAIEENRATSQAFVSLRIMENMKATYYAFRAITKANESKSGYPSPIDKPKSIIVAVETFMLLFKEAQRKQILEKVDFEGFKRIVDQKNAMPFNEKEPDFDTKTETDQAKIIVRDYNRKMENVL